MATKHFYKTSPHANVGTSTMFHGLKGMAYVSNIDSASIYSLSEAQQEAEEGKLRNCVNEELFVSVEDVDKVSIWKVDCQYIALKYPKFKDPNNEYVAYAKSVWDGNDLGFSSGLRYSFDYAKAAVFTEEQIKDEGEEANERWVFVPKFHADECARRTFPSSELTKCDTIRVKR